MRRRRHWRHLRASTGKEWRNAILRSNASTSNKHRRFLPVLAAVFLCQAMEDTAGSQAQVSYQRALAQLANRNLRAALPDLEQSYQLGLRHAAVVLSLAKCRFAAGQDAAAVDLLNGAIQKATT